MTPSGTRGVLNDAVSIYFADPSLATAFVARWYAGYSVETSGGVFQVREDEPTPTCRGLAAPDALSKCSRSAVADVVRGRKKPEDRYMCCGLRSNAIRCCLEPRPPPR